MADVINERGVRLDEPGLQALAAALAGQITPPLTLYLEGDLGAGKTTFARALIQAAGYAERVKSPTYGLMEHYPAGELEFLHLDLYRIGDPGELEYLGIVDLMGPSTVLLVEWPDRGAGALPPADAILHFRHDGLVRRLEVSTHSDSGIQFGNAFRALSD